MQNHVEAAGAHARSATPPRVYMLQAAVAGEAARRAEHLARIAALGFDWVCWTQAGGGADPAALDDLVEDAGRAGLASMLEIDPYAAGAIAAADGQGFAGYLAVAVWRKRAAEWRALIGRVRDARPDLVIVGDNLGRPWEETQALADGGFDFLLNSTAWWDLRAPWFVRQHAVLGAQIPTLATPEPLRDARLAHRLGQADAPYREAIYYARYLLAATASSGLVCPMGFEIGTGQVLNGPAARPSDWDFAGGQATFDLSTAIGRINQLKATAPVLAGEGGLRIASAPGAPVLALVRTSAAAPGEAACLVVNTTGLDRPFPPRAELALAAGSARFMDALTGQEGELGALAPYEARLLFAEPLAACGRPPPPDRSEARLRELATNRVVIERVTPELDGGRFPVKRVVGETLLVEADIFSDGQDVIDAALAYRLEGDETWREAPMRPIDNDRWGGSFVPDRIGRWRYTVRAWRDRFATWRQDVTSKHDAGQPVALELIEGRRLVEAYRASADGETAPAIDALLRAAMTVTDEGKLLGLLVGAESASLMRRAGLRTHASRYEQDLVAVVDRPLAACAAWYEMMPRSQAGEPGRHGTFDDVIARLPYVRDLGFDVLYFPPVHPIGASNRKGRNNSLKAEPSDPGSPYAIGAGDGGHTAIHGSLGDFADFERLVAAARAHGLEIALDFAIQCSPDHPWIKQHPEWFDWRPDGSIKFAENPPKKYEDIVNVHFYRDALPSLWFELRDVVRFWIDKGVTIFRVDNPHTKPVPFWEWLIGEIKEECPRAVFLAEAFTRPKMMRRLAKAGFTQSYSYFTWRNTKQELTDYLTELTQSEVRDYMHPNFFANTPDINPRYLQTGGRAGFQTRLVLAATLNPLYGIYNGFELADAAPVPGKEEYLNSEKYEIRAWDWDRPGNIKDDVRLINRIRRENPALWRFANLTFLNAWNDSVLAYYKVSEGGDNLVVVAVNLDPHSPQGASFEVPLWAYGLPDGAAIEAVDLIEDRRFTWTGKQQHVWLDPKHRPYAIWRLVPPGAG